MFNSGKNKEQNTLGTLVIERNRISKKSTFKGSIISEGDFRIDGTVEGDLTTEGKVIIGPDGRVLGKMKCANADIEGVFKGRLEVKKSLCLKPTARVSGDVFMESLTVQPGAVFNANCKMLSVVKELNPGAIDESKKTEKGEYSVSEVS